jgi:glycosyltransferase involved in cell wall biosynthesis
MTSNLSDERPTVVAVIPAFNEERTIAKVVIRALRHASKVVVVDDGSRDDTAIIAEKLGAVVERHERNLGKGAALQTCLEWANKLGADVVVTLDADGQHDPDAIPSMVAPILNGVADIVIGTRAAPSEMPTYRRLGAKLLDRLTGIKVAGVVADAQSGFKAYSKQAVERVIPAEYGMGADTEMLMKARMNSLRVAQVPITVRYKGLHTSTHNPLYHWLDVFSAAIKFVSIRHPLMFYGGFSAIMFLLAFVFGFLTLDYYSKYGSVITNLALISIASGILAFLSLFTGVILFTIITVLRERERRQSMQR